MAATRNPFFVGHEELLQKMREALEQDHVVAINGQAGMGKTELARTYADRHIARYQPILWLNGATYATLLATLCAQPQRIELSAPHIQARPPLIQALRNWQRAHQGSLLMEGVANSQGRSTLIPRKFCIGSPSSSSC